MSQAMAGYPMTRSFISRVERGRLTPSLPSLLIIAARLRTTVAAILAPVESRLTEEGIDAGEDGPGIIRGG
jgi:transcriptional regulator with XRE-family HTH domain